MKPPTLACRQRVGVVSGDDRDDWSKLLLVGKVKQLLLLLLLLLQDDEFCDDVDAVVDSDVASFPRAVNALTRKFDPIKFATGRF